MVIAAQSFTPLFTWNITSMPSVHDVSAVPSMATLTGYISRTTSEVQDSLLRHQTQLLKLQNIAALTPEEKQDILEASDEDYLDDLAAIQRDQLAVQVLQKMLLTSTQEVMSALCKCSHCLCIIQLFLCETRGTHFSQFFFLITSFAGDFPCPVLATSGILPLTVPGHAGQRDGHSTRHGILPLWSQWSFESEWFWWCI